MDLVQAFASAGLGLCAVQPAFARLAHEANVEEDSIINIANLNHSSDSSYSSKQEQADIGGGLGARINNLNGHDSLIKSQYEHEQQHLESSSSSLGATIYESMPSSMQYVLYDFWEMFHNPELNKYALFNGGPWLLMLFVGSYLYFVLRAGPRLMEKRQAYDLKPYIRLYNFGMVLFNAYLFYHASPFLNFGLWCWGCNRAVQPMALESIPIVWLVLISRFFDFFDTIFFILRKKMSHVSFLHVFHHTVVPIGFWIGIKFAFFPVCCFIPYLNLVVHVIMYSYYGLSTFGPRVQKYLWWKKYLTRLQITQFLIALVHSLQPLYLRQCEFPFIFVMGQTLGALLFLQLFLSFYFKAYAQQRRASSNVPPSAADLDLAKANAIKAHATTVDKVKSH